MSEWDHEALAAKWQQRWWDAGIQHSDRPTDRRGTKATGRRGKGAGDAPAEEKPTYFLHFAYPGISGYLHVGHMRGFTYGDVFTRFARQTGKNALYPAGFHASGIPAVAFAKEVERGERTEYLRANGYDEKRDGPIAALVDPAKVVEYFANVYTNEYWKKFGFLIDERRNCTTIDPGYQRFIQWQFRRLAQNGWLIEKPHYAPFCPVSGPVAVDKSETDIKQGGNAEVQEFLALRFSIPTGDIVDTDDDFDRIVLPCATLRPETVYGVTNLWVQPDHVYELVRVWKDGAVGDDDENEVWLVSQQGRRKLEWQMERAEALDVTVPGTSLVGTTARAPVTRVEVPVVAGTFVDPMIASGIVMSVPGHAPYDWAAYVDAGLDKTLGEPPRIVDIEGYDDLPARAACKQHGVTSQADTAALDAATEQLYTDEFNKGVLNAACGEWAGRRIKAAKDELRAAFLAADHGRILRQFSEPVVSRAGEVVDIKRIPDQDFIHYADGAWTERAVAHAKTMRIFPQRYADDIENVLRWFGDRACVRRGAWLGTEFPFKRGWIIEPIADSTFYSWYYLVAPYVRVAAGHAGTGLAATDDRDASLAASDDDASLAGSDDADRRSLALYDLTDAFFDFVFNGRGDPDAGAAAAVRAQYGPAAAANKRALIARKAAVWRTVREDVLYWGPVDLNLGGKEHQTVHFPVWIMNNVGLLDDERLWPRGIFVNWWVTQKAGAKISKSKGGAEPIPGAAAKYGVDPMRLYYCHVGSPHVDIEWDPDVVLTYRLHVERIQRIADDLLAAGGHGEHGVAGLASDHGDAMDEWLAAAFAGHVRAARTALDAYDLRTAAGELVYGVPETLRWYQRRGGTDGALLRRVVREWATALCPFIPHTAEEMFERAGGNGLCSTAPYPQPVEPDAGVLARERYVQAVLEDAQTVRKLAGLAAPQAVRFFAAPAWKRDLVVRAVEMAARAEGKFPLGPFLGEVMADPAMRERGQPVQQFAARLPGLIRQWGPAQTAAVVAVDEAEALAAAAAFLARELGVPAVECWRADDPDAPVDAKREVAVPLKPGISLR